MTDLTEQFENDELAKGAYYCRSKLNGHKCLAVIRYDGELYDADYNGTLNKGFWVVLAPVPSYDEWQASEKYNKHLEEVIKIYERKDKQATETSIAYNDLLEENHRLKELLKEVEDYLPEFETPMDILAKIDEALK